MADIFISYKTEDHDRVEPLARALEAEGWDVWWDRELLAGTVGWGDTIATELANAKCVIVAWSKLAAASPWVRDEAQVAYSEGKSIPVLLEPMKLPLGFGQVQAAPFFDWRGGREEQAYQKLLPAIRAKLNQPAPTTLSTPPPRPAPNWRWIVATAVTAVVVISAMIIIYSVYSGPWPGRSDPDDAIVIATRLSPFEQRMSAKDMRAVLDILGCPGNDLGPAGSPARRALAKFLADNGAGPSDQVTQNVFIDLQDLREAGKRGSCGG